MHLTWLRSDLRIDDNTALSASTERGPTIALWLVSPGQWQAHDDADCKVDFWLRNLHDLRQSLEKLNIPLLIDPHNRYLGPGATGGARYLPPTSGAKRALERGVRHQ